MIRSLLIFMVVCGFAFHTAVGRDMKGVTFDESKVIAGTECPLIGVGNRKQLIISVFLGALYMQEDIQNS